MVSKLSPHYPTATCSPVLSLELFLESMGNVGRDHWRSSGPTSFLKQGHSRIHGMRLWFLNISGEGDSTASLDNPFQNAFYTGNKLFLRFRWELLCISFCLLLLVLLSGMTKKSLAPSSWHPSFRYLQTLLRCSISSLLKPQQAKVPQSFLIREMFQSPNHLDGPLLDQLQDLHVSLDWGAQNWTLDSEASSGLSREAGTC